MQTEIIDFNLKKKTHFLRKHPEFKILNLNFENIIKDIYFFKKNNRIIQKSEILFRKMIRKTRNYSKSMTFQQNFVEEFKKMG
ncbi:MAG: hypothetical protein WCF95_04870 [bacterium]